MTQPPKNSQKNLIIYGLFILLIFSLWIPLLPLITIWFFPLPFLLFAANTSSIRFFPLFLLVCGTITFLFGGSLLTAVVFLAAIVGTVMGRMYRGKGSTGLEVFMSGLFVGAISLLFLTLLGNQVGILDSLQKMLEEQWAATGELLQSYGMDQEQSLMDLLPIGVFLPSVIAYFSLIFSLANLWVGRRILLRWRFPGKYLPSFRNWRLPRAFFFFYFIVILISFFTGADGAYWISILSIQLLLWPLFLLQGYSFFAFLLHHWGKGRIWLTMVIIFSLLFPPAALIVHILGIMDTGTQIREFLQKRDKKD